MPRFYSLAALIAIWAVAAALVQSRLLPGPLMVGAVTLADLRSGELPYQMGCTLARVAGSVIRWGARRRSTATPIRG